ncbi:sugar kinase [Rhizosphaericola mali]|uniref:Sugar kinase n=1 Tax=Rhizosphaericola mali TaxID=2545455 RepID=A0A5P2G4R6_9BACT|nr:sugar kinase [Rhizosphaericola mali]QES88812.1 sugar kinase [Rhizosphaericola mali]
MKKNKVLSFGELLLRIGLDAEGEWLESNTLPFYLGGAELNVATALALWDIPSAYLSVIPDNEMSHQIIKDLKKKKIDTSRMILDGERLGIYYLAKGKDLKNSGVIYDRANSSYANMQRNRIDWEKIFEDVSWFHFSAICPALNQNVADICLEAVKFASQKDIFISLDLNYRSKLWKYGKDPKEVMPKLAEYCNLIMGNIWAANQMLGTRLDDIFSNKNIYTQEQLLQQSAYTSKEIIDTFQKCTIIANTFRFDNKDGIHYYSSLYSKNELKVSANWEKEEVYNRVGSGDCFMAGLIYGYYNNLSEDDILAFATAAAVDKLDISGDATTSTVAQIKSKILNK